MPPSPPDGAMVLPSDSDRVGLLGCRNRERASLSVSESAGMVTLASTGTEDLFPRRKHWTSLLDDKSPGPGAPALRCVCHSNDTHPNQVLGSAFEK